MRGWITFACCLCLANAGMWVLNEVVVWKPTIMAYYSITSFNNLTNDQDCPETITKYRWLGVGEKSYTNSNDVCASYTPLGLMWTIPQYFKRCERLGLNGSISQGQLTYEFHCAQSHLRNL